MKPFKKTDTHDADGYPRSLLPYTEEERQQYEDRLNNIVEKINKLYD
jgi:hypothetical protein